MQSGFERDADVGVLAYAEQGQGLVSTEKDLAVEKVRAMDVWWGAFELQAESRL